VKRVAVVGSGGAGKSTLARELGEITGFPVVHLDNLYWNAGWVETPDDEWRTRQRELLSSETWIVDGNYQNSFDIRFPQADTVILLGFSRYRCLFRAFTRTLLNYGECVQAEGCPERFDFTFYKWIWQFPIESRPRLLGTLNTYGESLIELTSPRQVKGFLNSCRAK
jgi:adenylate kinase family enzyme